MATNVIEELEIELAGKKVIVQLLRIERSDGVVWFKVSGKFKERVFMKDPLLEELREKYKK